MEDFESQTTCELFVNDRGEALTMLVEFSVENYRSVEERQTFSMVASADKTMLDCNSFPMPNTKDLRLLTSAIIYGPNASGKSNLVRAMFTMKMIVVQSATRMQAGDNFRLEPFRLNTNYYNKPSCFEIIFILNETRYHYGFSLDQKRIYEEWLVAYPNGRAQNWFKRKFNSESQQEKWYFGPGLKGERERIKNLVRPNSLFLSHAAQNNHHQLNELFQWFKTDFNFIGPNLSGIYTAEMCKDDQVLLKDDVVKFLIEADLGISDLKITSKIFDEEIVVRGLPDKAKEFIKEIFQDLQNKEILSAIIFHKMNDSDQMIQFDLTEESEGTQRMFEIAGSWLDTLNKGSVLCIDEIDRSLHTLLAISLLKIFNNQNLNKNQAQLIATTHDTALLDREFFRRDQVWFTEKDSKSSTKLYSLMEFKPRKDESLQKGYLQGRYGAIPFIGKPRF